jgi:pantoate--beta-alanine ligase
MDRARELADTVVVSLFVNPAQFGPGEDWEAYPRDPERDAALAAERGVDVLFTPSTEAMYPEGFATRVEVPALSRTLCGASRPTHFAGVCTVVARLLVITAPHAAVFGEKDFQQLAVIRRMTADLGLGVDIVGHPIVREPDGLAMSSRNVYLEPKLRAQAPGIHQGLGNLREQVSAGERDAGRLIADLAHHLESRVPDAEVDYLALVDPKTLEPVQRVDRPTLAAVAVRLGRARLIDNLMLEPAA